MIEVLTDFDIIARSGELYLVVGKDVDLEEESNPPAAIYNSFSEKLSKKRPLQVFFKWGNFVAASKIEKSAIATNESLIELQNAIVELAAKEKGPGPGWWGPPRGTHGAEREPFEKPSFARMARQVSLGGTMSSSRTKALQRAMLTKGLPEEEGKRAAAAKGQISRELSERTGLSELEVSKMTAAWANTSTRDVDGVRLQESAAEVFGVKRLSPYLNSRVKEIGEKQGSFSPDARKRFLEDSYRLTQERLGEYGFGSGDKIRVWRGVALENRIAGRLSHADEARTGGNPLSSWSLSIDTAEDFAKSMSMASGGRRSPVVFSADVPVGMIVSTCRTGLGCLKEQEVVVMGASRFPARVVLRGSLYEYD